MLNYWFYSHSTWAVATVVCSALVILPLIALFFFCWLVPWKVREPDTKLVGLSYALCGSVYAVMLAFVAVGTYETMEKTSSVASEEANSLGGLSFDSAGLPAGLAVRLRSDIDKYIDIVTGSEWPNQRAYRMEERNYEEGLDIANFEPETQGQATVKAEMEHIINELFSARRARLLAAGAHLPDAVWQMLVFGLGLVAIYIFLFGPHSYRMHMAVTGMTMLSIGLVFTLIIALDYPFRGELSVGDEAYVVVKEVSDRAFSQATPASGAGAATREVKK
jgi:hypothetical protein